MNDHLIGQMDEAMGETGRLAPLFFDSVLTHILKMTPHPSLETCNLPTLSLIPLLRRC